MKISIKKIKAGKQIKAYAGTMVIITERREMLSRVFGKIIIEYGKIQIKIKEEKTKIMEVRAKFKKGSKEIGLNMRKINTKVLGRRV